MIGQTISHYKINDKLGEGGMGVVYKAQDTKLDRTVALKFLPPHLTQSKEDKRRFIREAKSAAALNHPYICTIHNIDEHDGRQFIVMEYIEGETLRTKIDRGELTVETALKYATKIADALGKAHQNDIIHRDIKPENIMIDEDGRIKVMDFGLAKLKQARDITKTGDTVGTLAYMSPEQIRGQQVDYRSDLFSLGIVLYEMLTGAKPFQGEHQAAMTYSIVNEEPEPLETYLPEAPEELMEFFDRCLAKEPEDRLGSAAEVIDKLKNIVDLFGEFSQQTKPTQAETEASEQDSGSSTTISLTIPTFGIGGKYIGKTSLIVGVTVLLALALFAGWWFIGGNAGEHKTAATPDGKKSEIANHSIAVLPFEVSGGGAEEWKDGMVTTLSLNLDGAAGLRAIPDRTIFAEWKQKRGSENIRTQEALDIAREVGARYAVVGSAVQLGQDLRFGVEIREVASGERLGQVEVRGTPDSLTALTNNLSKEILGVLLERSEEAIPSVNLESITTESLPALKAFLQGERHVRAGKNEAAINDYEESISIDSSFALAYARIAFLGLWHHAWDGEAMRRAYELSGQLPERDRRLVEALYMGRIEHKTLAAAKRFRQLTEEYPDDPSVWNSLGEFVFHAFIPGGVPEVEAAHKKLVRLDPSNISYYDHYVLPAFHMHRDSAMAAKRIESMPESKWKQNFQNSLKLVFGSSEQKKQAISRLDTLSIPGPGLVIGPLVEPTERDLMDKALRRIIGREDITDSQYQNILVRNDLLRGQVKQALKDFEKQDIETSTIATALSLESTVGIRISDSVANKYLAPENLASNPSIDRLHSTGIYLIEQGQYEEADQIINRILSSVDATDNKEPSKGEVGAIVEELKGYRAWKSGNPKEAEQLLNRSNESFIPGAIWRGDLYRELGDLNKAKEWYLASLLHPVAYERLGMLYEQMDKPEKAADAYRRFIVAWKDADRELQDRVEQARQRLQQLSVSEQSTTEEVIDVEE